MTLEFGAVRTRVLTGPGPGDSRDGSATVCRNVNPERPVLLVVGSGETPAAMLEMTRVEALALRDLLTIVVGDGSRLPS
jgi:hypothetical protein